MIPSLSEVDSGSRPGREFLTTHWSVVLAAGQESPQGVAALEDLCRVYWKPLYSYVRRQGHDTHEAQDLTQEFFSRLLQKHYLELADPARGRFRTFLLTSLKRFLINDWKHACRQKRGGGEQPLSLDGQFERDDHVFEAAAGLSPDQIYEKRWAEALLEEVLRKLEGDYEAVGMERLFHELKVYIWGEKNALSYVQIGEQLGLTEGAVKVAAHRMRRRFRELLRSELSNTVADPKDIEAELQYLFEVIAN